MKILLVNGSPHAEGSTFQALSEVAAELRKLGAEAEIFHIGTQAVHGCIACATCRKTGRCIFQDDVMQKMLDKMIEADGIVLGSPVYYAGPSGAFCTLLERAFYSGGGNLRYKPAAAVVVCRRGGASATFDRLNKFFTINRMPIVSSQYWNSVHARIPADVPEDQEGLQTMRTLAQNMHWMVSALKNQPRPKEETPITTSFTR